MEYDYIYYWYHHISLSDKAKIMINKIILKHDYNAFLCIKETIEGISSKYKDVYFPTTIFKRGDPIKLTEENFNKIQFVDCEYICESQYG